MRRRPATFLTLPALRPPNIGKAVKRLSPDKNCSNKSAHFSADGLPVHFEQLFLIIDNTTDIRLLRFSKCESSNSKIC